MGDFVLMVVNISLLVGCGRKNMDLYLKGYSLTTSAETEHV